MEIRNDIYRYKLNNVIERELEQEQEQELELELGLEQEQQATLQGFKV